MSEEIALAAADLETVIDLGRALAVAMEENEGWRRLATVHERRASQLESQLGTALAEIARLEAALRLTAGMKSIIGARRITAEALEGIR